MVVLIKTLIWTGLLLPQFMAQIRLKVWCSSPMVNCSLPGQVIMVLTTTLFLFVTTRMEVIIIVSLQASVVTTSWEVLIWAVAWQSWPVAGYLWWDAVTAISLFCVTTVICLLIPRSLVMASLSWIWEIISSLVA